MITDEAFEKFKNCLSGLVAPVSHWKKFVIINNNYRTIHCVNLCIVALHYYRQTLLLREPTSLTEATKLFKTYGETHYGLPVLQNYGHFRWSQTKIFSVLLLLQWITCKYWDIKTKNWFIFITLHHCRLSLWLRVPTDSPECVHHDKSWLREMCIIIFVSKQFSVPGNNIVLSPELYITVLAYTSILNPEAPQVRLLVHCSTILILDSYKVWQCWLPRQSAM